MAASACTQLRSHLLSRPVGCRLAVPVGVQFVHGRWVAAGSATAAAATTHTTPGVIATAGFQHTSGPSLNTSSPTVWSGSALTTVSKSSGNVDGSASPPSVSPSSRLLNDASDSQSSTPDVSPAAARPISDSRPDEAAAFPDDLDDLPDWDGDGDRADSSGVAARPVGSQSPSTSLLSTTSSISSLSCPPPADEFDELDNIPDFDSSAAPPAVPTGTERSRSTSELLAAKMAQFPDDMTVVELKEIDDQPSTADDNTSDGETDDDDRAQSPASTAPHAAQRVPALQPPVSADADVAVPAAPSLHLIVPSVCVCLVC